MSDFKNSLSYANRSIAYLFNQVNQQNKLRKQVQAVLPQNLAEHIQSCRIKDETLIIYTHSSIWASQYRFHSRNILEALQLRVQKKIQNVQIKILPAIEEPQSSHRHAKPPSSENIKQLAQTNNPNPNDKLEIALQKLSKTLERRKKNDNEIQ